MASGASIYSKCINCHGESGQKRALGRSAIIKGQNYNKTVKQLLGYKRGILSKYGMGGLMRGQVASMSNQHIKQVAKYISKMR